MKFKDHPAYAPNSEMYRRIGPPCCPYCLDEIRAEDEIQVIEGDFMGGELLAHAKCGPTDYHWDSTFSQQDLGFLNLTGSPDAEMDLVMGQNYPIIGKREIEPRRMEGTIEVPTWRIVDGERVKTGSITYTRRRFHERTLEDFTPSEVPDSLEGFFRSETRED